MSEQAKRGRKAGVFVAGSTNDKLARLGVDDTTVWLTDDHSQLTVWQRHISAKRSSVGTLAGCEFSTQTGVLVLPGACVEYALKITRVK